MLVRRVCYSSIIGLALTKVAGEYGIGMVSAERATFNSTSKMDEGRGWFGL